AGNRRLAAPVPPPSSAEMPVTAEEEADRAIGRWVVGRPVVIGAVVGIVVGVRHIGIACRGGRRRRINATAEAQRQDRGRGQPETRSTGCPMHVSAPRLTIRQGPSQLSGPRVGGPAEASVADYRGRG